MSPKLNLFRVLVAALAVLGANVEAGADTNATATLKGRVVYADGQPAAGALVDALFAMPQNRMSQSLKRNYRTETDAAGNYVLTGLARDMAIPDMRVTLGEYSDWEGGISFKEQPEVTLDFELELNKDQQPMPDEAAKLGVHTPREPRHRTFSGRVARQDGSVVEGALVAFGEEPGIFNYSSTQTDSQGNYTLSAVTSRSVLAVQARGCAPAFQFVRTRGDARFDFVLKPGHWIEGRTLDRHGKPVGNVAVTARASALFGDKRDLNSFWRYRLATSRSVSGADGKFRLENLPTTGVLVSTAAAGFTPVQARAMETDRADQVLTLLPIGRIVGRVVRLTDALPVGDFTVSVVMEDQVPAGKPYDGRVPIYQYGSKRVHSQNGLFTLPDQNTDDVVGVVIEADGYRREGARVTIPSAETADQNALTFRLSDQLVFTGVVPTAGDSSNSDLLVAVPDGRLKGGDFEFAHRPEADRTAVTGRTDASGAFRLNGVRAHRGPLLIDNPGSWRSLVRDISLEEPFQAEAFVYGKLTRDGKPVIRERIDLDGPKPGDETKAICWTGPAGEYCLYVDRLGDYRLVARLATISQHGRAITLARGENRHDLDVGQTERAIIRPGK